VALGAATGCHTFHPARATPQGDATRILITQEMIERSHGQTAWEVLKREAPQLSYREKRNGQPAALERRGRSSFVLNDAPMVFVDGVRLADFRALEQLPAATLFSIEVLTGIEGTTYYGTDAVSGVILIHTKNGAGR